MVTERVQGYGASCWDAECSSPGRVCWVFKRNEIHISKRDLNSEVHCSPSHHSQDMETTQVSVQQMNDYVLFRYPALFERLPFPFYGKSTLVLCSVIYKKKKRFLLLQKELKVKIVFIICFAVNLSRLADPPWGTTLSISAWSVIALNSLRDHLCFVFICFANPLARSVTWKHTDIFALPSLPV